MKDIIPAIDRAVLEQELNADRFVRHTNNGNNLLYICNAHNSPNVIREIGRLRELTFRDAGGGTGLDCDLDDFDTGEFPYEQLIVWNPEDREILGGYRFICCGKARRSDGSYHLATTELFSFSEKFCNEFLPTTIELGRSFVQPQYQSGRKSLFALDNLWDGLGALTVDYPDMHYFFGKVTMYNDFNREARNLILHFMQHYFPDPDALCVPLQPLPIDMDMSEFETELDSKSYKDGHVCLNRRVRALGENIPPLFNAYMNTSGTMRTFGTAPNHEFGDVEETGILVTIPDIYPTKKDRHVSSYLAQKTK